MGRVYTVDIAPVAITVAADIIELTPADDKPIEILGIVDLLQTTELGDAAEEIIGLVWVRGHTTSGSGGAAPTPTPLDPNDAAAGFTAEALNTTPASVGTTTNLLRHGWNVRQPLTIFYPPECLPQASQANTTLVLRMAAAPGDSTTISGSIIVREK
jgi:hypothetical protein